MEHGKWPQEEEQESEMLKKNLRKLEKNYSCTLILVVRETVPSIPSHDQMHNNNSISVYFYISYTVTSFIYN